MFAEVPEPLDSQAIIDGDADNPVTSERGAVVDVIDTAPRIESTAVNPDQHR